MIKVVFASILVMSSYIGFSQDVQEASVEKSIFGIQVGLIGIWAHNELKLSNHVALRSVLGLGGVNSGDIEPLVAIEPRWYYNLNKRINKGKRTDGNSGNYISLRTEYRFYDISKANKTSQNYFLLTPTWGIRRNLGKHFNYEAGIGFGLGLFNTKNGRETGVTTSFNLKIGYRF